MKDKTQEALEWLNAQYKGDYGDNDPVTIIRQALQQDHIGDTNEMVDVEALKSAHGYTNDLEDVDYQMGWSDGIDHAHSKGYLTPPWKASGRTSP